MPEFASPSLSTSADWPVERVASLKGSTRIAVVIPARNEEATVAHVVADIAEHLGALVDELVVMDSLSTDRTAEVARVAGARVHSVADVRPDLGVRPGKGEAMWKSMFVTDADLVAFIDADLTEWGVHFVTGVLGPLLVEPRVMLCRGFYDRLLDTAAGVTVEGGRVTELVARPWLALFRPELAGMVQPLAGEWAIRRSVFEQLSIPVGYGVEFATLLDVHERFGPSGIAQVDLGQRGHRHQNIHDLAAMAVEVLATGERRRRPGESTADVEWGRVDGEIDLLRMAPDRTWASRSVVVEERPPIASLPPEPTARLSRNPGQTGSVEG